MNNIKFSPHIFLRTPALSYTAYNSSKEIIKSHFFQLAILFASESFYMELKKFDFDYDRLDKKIKLTIEKYVNRMCYRPTPFGLFSSFTTIDWGLQTNNNNCILGNNIIYINPDFQLQINLGRELELLKDCRDILYFSNKSIYNIKNEKRYLTVRYDKQLDRSIFSIASFKPDRLLNKVILFCKNGKNKKEIVEWISSLIDRNDGIIEYVDDLIAEGLLISEMRPNFNGKKYFDRLLAVTNNYDDKNDTLNLICKYKKLADIKQIGFIKPENLIKDFSNPVDTKNKKSAFYVGYEKESSSELSIKYQEDLRDALFCLDKLTTPLQSKSLNDFKAKFRAKFEDQEISLLQALDREAGIGYDGLESNLFNSELLDGIQMDLESNNQNFVWTAVHEYFLTKLSSKIGDVITISEKDLEKIKSHSNLKTPPSFSIIFRFFNNKIWIEQVGGCTASSLLGRFTHFNKKIFEKTLTITKEEKELNKDIIFAEVSCYNDEHAANIMTNAGIRDYEIPIEVHSPLKKSNIINLSDIMISLSGDEIILRSKKLNKIIIPRLSSAYNYNRSDLSIYRFLCDFQYQGLKSNYNFELKTLLPGLTFYPRIEYKNCILSPATWLLSIEEISKLTDSKNNESFTVLARDINLSQCFAFTEGDNQLVFDRDKPESIAMFINVIKNKNSVMLQEYFIDEAATVKADDKAPLIGQFTASVVSTSPTYVALNPILVNRKTNVTQRIYLPGDEWLYFKLYCHPSIANTILTKRIKPIINLFRKKSILKCWYYIRYNDVDNHLRIRVQINKNNTTELIQYFEKTFRNYVQKGSLNNFMVDTYKREIEKYGVFTITYAEKMFETSSDLVVKYLNNISKSETNYSELHLAILSIYNIINIFLPLNIDKINILNLIHENMKHEFEDSKQVKVQLDNKYREYSSFISNIEYCNTNIIKITGAKEFNAFLNSTQKLRENAQYLSKNQLFKLIADIMHMHLNRVFSDKQRKQEFIIYYLINKYFLSVEARLKKESSMFSGASNGFVVNNIKKVILK
ncbi:lantibiotic dehydratase [Mucilaginibacter sp.]